MQHLLRVWHHGALVLLLSCSCSQQYKHRIGLGFFWVFFCSFLLLNISLPHTETMIKINVSPQHFHPQILISLLTSNRNYLEKFSVFLERGPSILLILPITIRRTISINSLQIKVHVSNNTISNGFCFYLIFIRTPYVNLFLLI